VVASCSSIVISNLAVPPNTTLDLTKVKHSASSFLSVGIFLTPTFLKTQRLSSRAEPRSDSRNGRGRSYPSPGRMSQSPMVCSTAKVNCTGTARVRTAGLVSNFQVPSTAVLKDTRTAKPKFFYAHKMINSTIRDLTSMLSHRFAEARMLNFEQY
jgi:hypothetical protein